MNISVLERLLNEGQAVDAEVKSIIKTILPEDMRDTAVGYINKLPWVKRSQNGKDAIPTAKWLVSMAGNVSWDRAVRQLGRLIQLKDRLNTTKRMDLAKLYDQYPTYDQLKDFLDDEKEKLANGWKDDFGTDVDVVDDDPDEVRMQRIRKDLGKPTFSTPGVVDIYRADTQAEAIRLGNGYSWCISYTTGDNYFYHYRMNPTSTAYFCFFNEPQPEYDDVACVIHVGENGNYRMTNAQNDNGSPMVDEERIVYCYPPLEKWLPKMTVVELSDKEYDFAELKKKSGAQWLALDVPFAKKYRFSRSDWRMILNMGAGLEDDLFDYLLDKYDHGKINDKDSLINLYTKVTVYPLTKHQEEVVSKNRSLLNFYKERHEGKITELAREYMDRLIDEGTYDITHHTLKDGADFVFYEDVYPIENDVERVTVSPLCQFLSGIPRAYTVEMYHNKYIESLDGLSGVNVRVSGCSALEKGSVDCCSLTLENCPNLKWVFLDCLDTGYEPSLKFFDLPKLESIEGLRYFDEEETEIELKWLPSLKVLPELPETFGELIIRFCPNIEDFSSLKDVTKVREIIIYFESAKWLRNFLANILDMVVEDRILFCPIKFGFTREVDEIYDIINSWRYKHEDVKVEILESKQSPLHRLGYVLKGLHE